MNAKDAPQNVIEENRKVWFLPVELWERPKMESQEESYNSLGRKH